MFLASLAGGALVIGGIVIGVKAQEYHSILITANRRAELLCNPNREDTLSARTGS